MKPIRAWAVYSPVRKCIINDEEYGYRIFHSKHEADYAHPEIRTITIPVEIRPLKKRKK